MRFLVPEHLEQIYSSSLQLFRHQGTHISGNSTRVRQAHQASVTDPVM
jgi:hypothetical protein